MKEPVGIVGMGSIGAGVARALASHGYTPVGYDVHAEAVEAMPGLVSPAASLRDLSDRVGADEVERVVRLRDAAERAAAAARAGRVSRVVEHDLDTVRRRALHGVPEQCGGAAAAGT